MDGGPLENLASGPGLARGGPAFTYGNSALV